MNIKAEFLYWFRDNGDRPIQTDLEWATVRFEKRFHRQPGCVLVHPNEETLFKGCSFNVKSDSNIQEGYFGLL
jgi:hypothetical protein